MLAESSGHEMSEGRGMRREVVRDGVKEGVLKVSEGEMLLSTSVGILRKRVKRCHARSL